MKISTLLKDMAEAAKKYREQEGHSNKIIKSPYILELMNRRWAIADEEILSNAALYLTPTTIYEILISDEIPIKRFNRNGEHYTTPLIDLLQAVTLVKEPKLQKQLVTNVIDAAKLLGVEVNDIKSIEVEEPQTLAEIKREEFEPILVKKSIFARHPWTTALIITLILGALAGPTLAFAPVTGPIVMSVLGFLAVNGLALPAGSVFSLAITSAVLGSSIGYLLVAAAKLGQVIGKAAYKLGQLIGRFFAPSSNPEIYKRPNYVQVSPPNEEVNKTITQTSGSTKGFLESLDNPLLPDDEDSNSANTQNSSFENTASTTTITSEEPTGGTSKPKPHDNNDQGQNISVTGLGL